MNAIDTNVLLYSIDSNEPTKQLKAQRLLQELHRSTEPSVLLWQVLGESAHQLKRWLTHAKLTQDEYSRQLDAFRQLFPIALPTAESFDAAIQLSTEYSLSHWDSMLLGACRTAGVTRLYTEDMGAPRVIDNITLINPFS